MREKIAIALDFSSIDEVRSFLEKLNPKPQILKVGLEMISSIGIVESIRLIEVLAPTAEVFLDFKLHDIPNTVASSIRSLKKSFGSKLKYLTIHTLGGSKMIKAALQEAGNDINLVGVTILTSHSVDDVKNDFGIKTETIADLTEVLVKMSCDAGLRWFVASPFECEPLKKKFSSIKVITPGIRVAAMENDDQSRFCTPQEALSKGSDILVIGRPITKSKDPQTSWLNILT